MRKNCILFAALAFLPCFFQQASSQPVPPPPTFTINGVDAYAHSYSKSSANNVLDADVGYNNFWRKLTFKVAGDPSRLHISHWCTAADTQGTSFSEGPYENGQFCPDVEQQRSRGIQRVRFALAGSDAAAYDIRYECWVGCNGQPSTGHGGHHGSGEWCGVIPPNPALNCWVRRVAITISAR